jgi:hypothetical protein
MIISSETYLLKKKSSNGTQHYGFLIKYDGKIVIRQWHKPKIQGYTFMSKQEAEKEAHDMLQDIANGGGPPG